MTISGTASPPLLHNKGQGKLGLVLSGGGARGAYQAGVVEAIAEIATEENLPQPLRIITGVSAGAINAAYLAATADHFSEAAARMSALWSRLTSEQVFKTDALSAGASGLKFLTDAALGALYRKKLARSLLDTSPLRKLLMDTVPFENIPKNLAAGHLDALAITAMDYTDACSVTFLQSRDQVPLWSRSRRRSERTEMNADHVMASAAIPIFFPPAAVGDHHFGDGCLRNTAPLSPAIHLGADRLIVVSVRRPDSVGVQIQGQIEPSMARILGVILNALLLDAIDIDMERLGRVNQTISTMPPAQRDELRLTQVESLWIRPSQDIGFLASEHFDRLPRVIRYLVGGLGSSKEASELTSYLLFDPDYCGRLVRIGYEDGMANEKAIREMLRPA